MASGLRRWFRPMTRECFGKLVLSSAILCCPLVAVAQQVRKKPTRAAPPKLEDPSLKSVFFADVLKELKGEPPSKTLADSNRSSSNQPPSKSVNSGGKPPVDEESGWAKIISPTSLEDLIKESKLRLDEIVTTPAKFAGGGFQDARREFMLLTMLFGIVEQYPTNVRWQNSAKVARMKMSRVAASSKVGSAQAFNEAKLRLQDLNDLVSGTAITDSSPIEELEWSAILDRGPMMQSMEWALREKLIKLTADPKEFEASPEEIIRVSELISSLGNLLIQPGMEDADDSDYAKWSKALIEHSQAAVQAVKLGSIESAKEAAGKLDQVCSDCHEAGFG